MRRSKLLLAATALALCTSGLASDALAADPCQSAIVKSLAKYKKTYLKAYSKCVNTENKGSIAGDECANNAVVNLAITRANDKAKDKIAVKCTSVAQITGLGYRSDCQYEAATQGIEGTCAGLPVTTVDEFTECMKCWKGAELQEFLAILYASHANELCGNDLGETSPKCSNLDCSTPLPTQHDLGDTGENDCQVGIAKAGTKYLVKREKIIEKCLLKGCTPATCLAGTCTLYPTSAVQLDKAESVKQAFIQKKCGGNRTPTPTAPDNFCCRCGMGNSCMLIPDRPTCLATSGCSVQENKICDVDKCAPEPKIITWWNNCPETSNGTCPGAPVTDIDELISCVDSAAVAVSDELLCFQFPGYPCPVETTTTTTTTTTL